MKIHGECFPCLLQQALRTIRLTESSSELEIEILQAVARVIAEIDATQSPPANSRAVYRTIAELTDCEDPYYQIKRTSNARALQILPELRREIRDTEQELLSVVRFAVAGNIIDYGAYETFDIDATLARSRTAVLAVDHFDSFSEALDQLAAGSTILYLADNCGEIVYDALLVEYLHRRGFSLVIAVKEGPIINDALLEDALEAGLDKCGRVISNGGRFPGTELGHCSPEFLEYFTTADLVIAKGQGNFESLSEVDRNIFFLLTIKCPVVAQHLAELAGVAQQRLTGKGELAVYYSRQNTLNNDKK